MSDVMHSNNMQCAVKISIFGFDNIDVPMLLHASGLCIVCHFMSYTHSRAFVVDTMCQH